MLPQTYFYKLCFWKVKWPIMIQFCLILEIQVRINQCESFKPYFQSTLDTHHHHSLSPVLSAWACQCLHCFTSDWSQRLHSLLLHVHSLGPEKLSLKMILVRKDIQGPLFYDLFVLVSCFNAPMVFTRRIAVKKRFWPTLNFSYLAHEKGFHSDQ